ncbi:PREDICTED: uncharacterized protein LOC105361122 [Ceratosolen solmsi marchali]|uniref:Uncharacterized protein LOC105361122 n=1 Tax=Ceratosolen solmsi marchali TaxID=326594 RepID=A0AAJ7DU35_9HYME|nr:PREDICTED: uncharacterized protein LOC105361122 [Ceratosolen solmsi marchali]
MNMFMTQYENRNHMRRLPTNYQSNKMAYYLPHHGVLKPDSSTTKLRVVFNGSSPSSTGRSLNDIMHTYADLNPNIVDVLIWIHKYRYLFSTDITKMYRQILVHQDDWDLQRILWIDELGNEVIYQSTTVTYGTRAAPFLAVRTLLQLIQDAVPPIKYGRYVDNIFGGADNPTQLVGTTTQLRDLCMAGGFALAKWHSTNEEVITAIEVPPNPKQSFNLTEDATKILGLQWRSHEDIFSFSTSLAPQATTTSKRTILSDIAKLFDPLGFASPVIIRAKLLLQELWLHSVEWNDPLPAQVVNRWHTIRRELQTLNELTIPRWFKTKETSNIELHGFADASQLAMAAVIYMAIYNEENEPTVTFICSKTRVAPLKKLTITKLELTTALLLSKLTTRIKTSLNLRIRATHLWTDSRVNLTWIKAHPSRWKEFVCNRVTQIQELTAEAQWRYVPGTSNPADCASRGLTTQQLKTHPLWWTDPPWTLTPNSWPTQPIDKEDQCDQEARPSISLIATIKTSEYD